MKGNLRALFIVVLVEIIGFGILFPIVPLLFVEPSSQFFLLPTGYSIDTGYLLLGLLVALYPIGQFFATPILGELSDVYGRKTVIQLSIFGTVVSTLLFGVGILMANIPLLFVSRLINGLTGGLIAVAQATIADISEASEKSKNFGLIGAAFGTGFIIGPFLGGVLSTSSISPLFTPTTPFWFAAFLSIVSMFYARTAIEETSPMVDKKINWTESFDNVFAAFKIEGMRDLFAVNFFYFTGFTFFTSFINVFLIERFSFTQFEIGNFFLYIGVLVIIGQAVLVPRFFSRFSEEGTLPYLVLATGAALITLYFPENLWVYLAIVPIFSFSNALTQVALQTTVSDRASDEEQGLVLGITQSLRSLGSALPPLISGVLAAAIAPEIPVLVAGAIIVLTAVVFLMYRGHP